MYQTNASQDTKCVVVFFNSVHMLYGMKWFQKAKEIMKLKRIRQEDLLEVFGVTTRGAVGHYLTGRRQPTPDQIKALAAHLGCTIDDLLSDESIDIVRQRMCDILDAADLRMKKSQHQFTDEERISVYRSVIASCLDMRVDNNQVNSYLDVLIKNNNH